MAASTLISFTARRNASLLSAGLQYLHEMEITHRDVKCENVLLTSNYNVKLADFGFARYMVDGRGKRVLSDTYCGSLSYVAPEILRGFPYNPKISDIWSLGVILYILLNKAMPFDETNIKRLYEQQIARKWKFRRKVMGNLTDHVKKLVSSLLEPDVSKRWRWDQIVQSDWIAMDPRLLVLTPAEQSALNNAIEERKKHEEKFIKRDSIRMQSLVRSLFLKVHKLRCLFLSFLSYVTPSKTLLVVHFMYTHVLSYIRSQDLNEAS